MGEPAVRLTRYEITGLLERGARERLHIDALEMVKRYHAGELAHPESVADLIGLASLLPETDPLFAGPRRFPVSPQRNR